MNSLKHKSMRPNPGVKRIQNYLFKFCDFLGKGNFSSVYKGINQVTKQTVAIKYIALDSLTCERLKQLLDQQIEVLTSLNHPNIVKCFEVLKSAHNCYIITQLCDGGDLQGFLKKKRTLTQDEIIPFARDIFQGLYYLSKKNIVHRDIKLANIFLSKGKAKIADFGFAQRAKKQFNDGKIGTPLCMSPEGFLENLYGCKTDVWAFGVILYQLAHGRLPCEHCTTQEMLKQSIQVQLKIDQLKPQLSMELKDLIIKCLDVNPCTRPTFQDMKSYSFIRKITGERNPSMSLHDLRYIPTFQSRQSEEVHHKEQPITSLRALDNIQSDQLLQMENTKQKVYGTNNIYEGLKPQNTAQKFEKQERLNVRPAKIIIPAVTYIPLRCEDKENINMGDQSPIILQCPNEQSEDYEIKVSHKSYTTLPNDSIDMFINIGEKDEMSLKSTTDRDFLEVPSTPSSTTFKRKGSCEINENQHKLITKMSYETENNRPITARQNFETTNDLSKRQKITGGIDICPLTNTKRLLNGFMKFNEAIGLIHYCRLIYKYIIELKSTGIYHEGDLNLRYYSNYLLNLMNELVNKITSDHIILTKTNNDQENKDNKLIKMKKVIEEYIERYRPNLEKQRGDYLNRTTGQIKQIAQLDQRFIQTFFIPDKSKLDTYNQKMVKFSEILEKCSRYQKYSQFDSNKQLEQSTKQEKKQRPLFAEKNCENISQNIVNNKQQMSKTQTIYNKQEPMQRRTSIQLQENMVPISMNQRRISFQ